MNVNVNSKGLHFIKEHSVAKKLADVEIEKLLGSSVNDNADEVAQFQADPFIADEFYMAWPKQKLLREAIKGVPEAADLPEQRGCSLSYKIDDNHNRHDCGAIKSVDIPVLNVSQSLPFNKTKVVETGPVDLIEAKTGELDSLLKESYEAYSLSQYGLAATKYKIVWEMITDATLKLRTEHINQDVVCYMFCLSLLETDQLNNLLEAVELLIALEKKSSRVFPAVYYALSKAHQKHYRFAMALEAVEAGIAFLQGDVELTEHVIPGSDVTLKESTKNGLSIALITMKDECSKWHPPDAVCCMRECLPSSRWYGPNSDIYFSDPAFNGMVALTCNNTRDPCIMKFHQACWKWKKEQLSPLVKLSDKDIIGHKCFTPNCEYGQGTRSAIIKIAIYGDDGKLKTHIEPTTNPVWTKRQPLSKGAIPKQQVSSKKLCRQVVATVPRSSCKEVTAKNHIELNWRLIKLARLRESNFGVKPGCEWRPDLELYGNPQMMEREDYSKVPIFKNDPPQLAAIKKFIFSYFHEFIKENGCVKREQILQKWEHDKIIFDNTSEVLDGDTDICDFLLQSYKLVLLGNRISIAENLPELYAAVRREISDCVRFVLADPLQPRKSILHEDTWDAIVNDDHEKKNQLPTSAAEKDPIIEMMEVETPSVTESSLPSQHKCESANVTNTLLEATLINSEVVAATNIDLKFQPTPEDMCSLNPTSQGASSVAKRKLLNDSAELEEALIFRPIGEWSNPTKQNEICDSSLRDTEDTKVSVDPKAFQTDSQSVSNGQEEGKSKIRTGFDSKDRMSPEVCISPGESEMTTDPQKRVCDEESYVHDSACWNFRLESTTDLMTETNQGLRSISSVDNDDSDATQSSDEENSLDNPVTVDEKQFPEASVEKKSDSESSTEFNVQKIEQDLVLMAKTVAQLKFALDQNQTKSENHTLGKESMSQKTESQQSMSELVKDLNRLKARYAQLESDNSVIMRKSQACELDLLRANDENVVLKFKNTEWMHKYHKLLEEKSAVEQNLRLLMKEMSIMKNHLELLQKERDKMDKKLQKYHARLKEKIDGEQAILAQEAEGPTERGIGSDERKLKLQSLSQEFSINKYALEQALDKCCDHVNMLNEVGNLISMVTGQRFIMVEAQAAWKKMDYSLRCTIGQYQEDYLKLKELLESDKEIENLNNIRLPCLNIVFPNLPNLIELYYKEKIKFIPPPPLHGLPTLWDMQGGHSLDPRYFSPPPPVFHVGQSLDPRSSEARNLLPAHPSGPHPQKHFSIPKGSNDDVKGAGIHAEPSAVTPKIGSRVLRDDSSTREAEVDEGETSLAKRPTSSVKKIGRDLLIQELRKKFVGVPEYDLMEAVQRVRILHGDTLSGMRLQNIVEEAEPFVMQLQAKHLAFYLPTKRMSTPQRMSLDPNATNQRKLPRSMLSGQRKKARDADREPVNRQVRSISPAVITKPAWAPVKSGLVEWKKNQEEMECTICLDPMNLYPVYALPCQHSFHMKCIKGWLVENSICPICRIHCTMDDEFPPLP